MCTLCVRYTRFHTVVYRLLVCVRFILFMLNVSNSHHIYFHYWDTTASTFELMQVGQRSPLEPWTLDTESDTYIKNKHMPDEHLEKCVRLKFQTSRDLSLAYAPHPPGNICTPYWMDDRVLAHWFQGVTKFTQVAQKPNHAEEYEYDKASQHDPHQV